VWEIKLFFGGIRWRTNRNIHPAIRFSVWLVDFVEHNDGSQTKASALESEFGLRHRAFSRVDQQDNTVNHGQMRSTSPPKSA
jgi:hypothetical protein